MTTDRIFGWLAYVQDRFIEHGIWHCLTYGTLLGAVRERDLIAWDYDFDLFVKPSQVADILSLNEETAVDGVAFAPMRVPEAGLAVNPQRVESVSASAVTMLVDGERVADLYAFTLFNDGILRRFDLERDAYWVPHSSFPHYFVERLETATIRGRVFPAPRAAAQFLAGVYGDDWRVPYRAVQQGGEPRAGATIHGDRFEPKLAGEIAWCEARGWNRARYRFEPAWPRPIRAAGPIGPTDRTVDSSRALWWRTVDELTTFY